MKASALGLRGNRCLCRTCGERFNSSAAFDAHRTGSFDLYAPHYGRRCLTVSEMVSKGMAKNPKGFWLTPRKNPRKPSGTPAYATQEKRSRVTCSGAAIRLSNRPDARLQGLGGFRHD